MQNGTLTLDNSLAVSDKKTRTSTLLFINPNSMYIPKRNANVSIKSLSKNVSSSFFFHKSQK